MTSSSSPPQSKIAAPYGSWKSPITADVVSGASKLLAGTAVDALGRLLWLESRPSESGPSLSTLQLNALTNEGFWYRRMVLVREPERLEDHEPVDITPKDFSVRTVAMGSESGGGFSVSGDTLIFSNFEDQRLYKQSLRSAGNLVIIRSKFV